MQQNLGACPSVTQAAPDSEAVARRRSCQLLVHPQKEQRPALEQHHEAGKQAVFCFCKGKQADKPPAQGTDLPTGTAASVMATTAWAGITAGASLLP